MLSLVNNLKPNFISRRKPEKRLFINPFVRQSLIFIVEFYISHEAAIEAHLAKPEAKKVAQDVLAGCKLLLPLLQAA